MTGLAVVGLLLLVMAIVLAFELAYQIQSRPPRRRWDDPGARATFSCFGCFLIAEDPYQDPATRPARRAEHVEREHHRPLRREDVAA